MSVVVTSWPSWHLISSATLAATVVAATRRGCSISISFELELSFKHGRTYLRDSNGFAIRRPSCLMKVLWDLGGFTAPSLAYHNSDWECFNEEK